MKELRNRIIVVIVAFVLSLLISFNYAMDIIDYFIHFGDQLGYVFVYLSPSELFMQNVRISIVSAIVIIIPVILYEAWAFIHPALKKSESLLVALAIITGLIFFFIGSVFSVYIVTPFMLTFFLAINQSSSITTSISIANYVSFYMSNIICFGIIFELPVVTTLLVELNVLRYAWLKGIRKIGIVCIFLIAAIITPPDIVSQFLCALPMCVLLEVSIQLSRLVEYRKQRKTRKSM